MRSEISRKLERRCEPDTGPSLGAISAPVAAELDLDPFERRTSKRRARNQAKLVAGLQGLLAMTESGQIKALCYAALDYSGDNFTVGVLRDESGLHEMIGLAQILNDSLLDRLRD